MLIMEHSKPIIGSSLRVLSFERNGKRKRVSSYDRSGGNVDFVTIRKNRAMTIANIKGAGCITHIWTTMMNLPRLVEESCLVCHKDKLPHLHFQRTRISLL